jgi:uncharacterized membrane protein YfcA
MEMLPFVLATAGLFAAGLIKGTTGLGYASCALPFLVFVVGLTSAMGIVLIPAMATNVVVAVTAGHMREMIFLLWPLYLAILPGIVAGLCLLQLVDQRIAVASLGIAMVLYSLFGIVRPRVSIPGQWQSLLKGPAGFLNGIVTGLTGSQVMPLIPFVMGLNLDPTRMVQAVNIGVIISSIVLGLGLAASGLLTVPMLVLSCAAVIPAALGTFLGSRLRNFLPTATFRMLTLVVLAAMGVGMLARL